VLGYVVLSRMMSWPGRRLLAIVSDVRFFLVVERGRHAYRDAIRLGEAREIGGRRKEPGFAERSHVFGGDVRDVASAPVQRLYFFVVGVEPKHAKPASAELQRQRQSHIAHADDADYGAL